VSGLPDETLTFRRGDTYVFMFGLPEETLMFRRHV